MHLTAESKKCMKNSSAKLLQGADAVILQYLLYHIYSVLNRVTIAYASNFNNSTGTRNCILVSGGS